MLDWIWARIQKDWVAVKGGAFSVVSLLIIAAMVCGFSGWYVRGWVEDRIRIYASPEQSKLPVPAPADAEIVVRPHAVYHIKGGNPLQAYVAFINAGKGIGDIDSWKFGVSVLDAKAGDAASTYTDLGGAQAESGVTSLQPREVIARYRQIAPLTERDIVDLSQDKKRIYVFGLLSYNNKKKTGFCYMFSGSEHVVREDGVKYYDGSQVKFCPDRSLNFRE